MDQVGDKSESEEGYCGGYIRTWFHRRDSLRFAKQILTVYQQIILSGVSNLPFSFQSRCEVFDLMHQLDICKCGDSKPDGCDSLRSRFAYLQCELERPGISDKSLTYFQGKTTCSTLKAAFVIRNPANYSCEGKKHVWITMVLMASFFLCIKMTLLFFYKRLFLVTVVSCASAEVSSTESRLRVSLC